MTRHIILFVIIAYFPLASLAHAAGATLHGTITAGPNATPLPNARIVIRGGGHEKTVFSSTEGTYEFTSLDPMMHYSITVDADGLRPVSRNEIAVREAEATRIDINLQLVDVRTTIVVTDGIINLEAASAQVSQTIDPTEVEELPIVNRTVSKYALLDPHVRQPLGLGADFQDANRLSINGGSYRHTSYVLDGTTNYDWVYAVTPQATVSPAAVEEVTVLTGNYSAQYGNSTNGIIAVTTSSGRDTLHGNLFSYIRPSGVQATPALAAFHVPNERLNWGANAGGPLIKDRTFFFASYEQMQQDSGSVITIPRSSFFDGRTDEYSGLFRMDHNLTRKNTLTARFNGYHYATNNANDRIAGGNQPSFGRTARVQSSGGQITDQAVIGNMVNIARFAYTNYFPDSAAPLDPSVGISIDHYNGGSSPAYQSGYSTSNWVHAQTETASDMLADRHGRHSWKFGGEFVHLRVRDYSFSPYGTYYFRTSDDFANNNPYKFTQTFGAADVRYGQTGVSGFVQDDIRLSSRLTANLGIRYEFQSITDSLHNLGPRVGLAWDATGDGKTVIRLGGGIFFDQYFMYINRRFITAGLNPLQFNYTWNCGPVNNPCPIYPAPSADPNGGSQSRFFSYIYVPADKLLNPYSLQFSASVERELRNNMVLTLSGLHTHTLRQMRVNDINHPSPFNRTIGTTPRSTGEADAARPFYDVLSKTCVYQGVKGSCLVDQIENTASSIYQAFDASVKKRFLRWGEINAHYVWSASYATAMFFADYNSGIPSEWWPNWNDLERGPSDFYQRHRFIADAVLRGPYKTTLSVVGNFGSGLPVNPLTGQDDNGDGYRSDRPVGLSRNSFHTPAQKTVDLAVAKQFTVRDRLLAETRVEALNVLNSKNFINVNNNYGGGATPSSSFLTPLPGIANTDPSRQLQFVVRLMF